MQSYLMEFFKILHNVSDFCKLNEFSAGWNFFLPCLFLTQNIILHPFQLCILNQSRTPCPANRRPDNCLQSRQLIWGCESCFRCAVFFNFSEVVFLLFKNFILCNSIFFLDNIHPSSFLLRFHPIVAFGLLVRLDSKSLKKTRRFGIKSSPFI